MKTSYKNSRGGFSLAEMALALLVIAIGLLAVFGMFPQGTDQNRRAIQETQISLFADYVMNGFRMRATEVDWSQVADADTFDITPLASQYSFKDPDYIKAGPGVKAVVYKALENDIEEMAFRYEFRVRDGASPDIKVFQLQVWPGAYGSLSTTNLFYSEVYNFKK